MIRRQEDHRRRKKLPPNQTLPRGARLHLTFTSRSAKNENPERKGHKTTAGKRTPAPGGPRPSGSQASLRLPQWGPNPFDWVPLSLSLSLQRKSRSLFLSQQYSKELLDLYNHIEHHVRCLNLDGPMLVQLFVSFFQCFFWNAHSHMITASPND